MPRSIPTPEQRREALLWFSTRRTLKQKARELNLSPNTLKAWTNKWRQQHRKEST